MITNQVMKRPMGNFLVEQRTKDSMFNATNLLKQWNDFVEHNLLAELKNRLKISIFLWRKSCASR